LLEIFRGNGWQRMSDAALATAQRYTWDDATTRLEGALAGIAEPCMAPSS
jgi:hypothetical protein